MSKKKSPPLPSPETLGLPPVGVESHAHLDMDPLAADLPAVLERARASGVARLVNVFLGPTAYEEHAPLFAAHPQVSFILGMHPHDAKDYSAEVLDRMEVIFASDKRIKALGEAGLDYFYDLSPRETQRAVFASQLDLARSLDIPVVVHSRDSLEDTLRILLDLGFAGRRVLWHCFGGDAAAAREVLSHGWFISIPGPVTYPKNEALRSAVTEIPLSRMALETDCPFLAPVPWRGKTNEPALMAFTAQAVAEAKGLDVRKVWLETGKTALNFFGLSGLDQEPFPV